MDFFECNQLAILAVPAFEDLIPLSVGQARERFMESTVA